MSKTIATKERPILFSDEMVRAILNNQKRQTRRVSKHDPLVATLPSHRLKGPEGASQWGVWSDSERDWFIEHFCPYGVVGDRLWVRETFLTRGAGTIPVYRATMEPCEAAGVGGLYGGWKPSIHMPRKFSRVSLEITGVRIERIKDITSKDVAAEGFPFSSDLDQFKHLWEKLNGPRGFGWDKNPWVWVIEFKLST